MTTTTDKVAVARLGYVGLPLAVAFGGRIDTIGFERNVDPTREVSNAELKAASSLEWISLFVQRGTGGVCGRRGR